MSRPPSRGEDEVRRRVLLQVGDARRARDREHHRGVVQQPGQADLGGGGVQLGCDRCHLRSVARLAPGDRAPGQECDVRRLARREDRFVFAVRQVVAVLDARDVHDLPGLGRLGGRHLGQADPAHLARGAQVPRGGRAGRRAGSPGRCGGAGAVPGGRRGGGSGRGPPPRAATPGGRSGPTRPSRRNGSPRPSWWSGGPSGTGGAPRPGPPLWARSRTCGPCRSA